jgi:hypothetical protein
MKVFAHILGVVALAAAMSANAAVVTTLSGGTALAIPAVQQVREYGPVVIGTEAVFRSPTGSVFGWTGNYGFNDNGSWSGAPMIGLNSGSGSFNLYFADPVSGFLGEMNWTRGYGGDTTVEIFDDANNLLERLVLESGGVNQFATGFFGFERAAADITSIVFSNEYVGVRNISIARALPANDVPEPASLALLGIGLAGVAAARRKAAKK